jgi:hypothetical protein
VNDGVSCLSGGANPIVTGVIFRLTNRRSRRSSLLNCRGPRIIAVAGNRGHLWGEQHRIETRTKPNHSRVNSGRLTIGGNYSRFPVVRLIDIRPRARASTSRKIPIAATATLVRTGLSCSILATATAINCGRRGRSGLTKGL